MAAFQKVIILGNLTREPEMRHTNTGMAVCEFTVAVNGTRDGDEPYFGAVVVFGKTAEACSRYLGKGSPVLVEGKLKNDEWEDKKTGQKRTKTRIVADNVQFIDRSNNSRQSGQSGQNSGYTAQRNAPRPEARQNYAPLPDQEQHRYTPSDAMPPDSDLPF